jgi:hypothetical protein
MRRFLTWRWCLAHLALVAAILVMLWLGLWQWHRANSSTGGMQNYAYALQWPLFGVFATVVYVKTMLDDARNAGARGGASPGRAAMDPAASGVRRQAGVRVGVSTPRVEIDADDAETQDWNARFAALNAADRRVEASRAAGARDRGR